MLYKRKEKSYQKAIDLQYPSWRDVTDVIWCDVMWRFLRAIKLAKVKKMLEYYHCKPSSSSSSSSNEKICKARYNMALVTWV